MLVSFFLFLDITRDSYGLEDLLKFLKLFFLQFLFVHKTLLNQILQLWMKLRYAYYEYKLKGTQIFLDYLYQKYEISLSLMNVSLNQYAEYLIDRILDPTVFFILIKLLELYIKELFLRLCQFCILIILIQSMEDNFMTNTFIQT